MVVLQHSQYCYLKGDLGGTGDKVSVLNASEKQVLLTFS